MDFTLDRRVILWESPLIREIGPNGKELARATRLNPGLALEIFAPNPGEENPEGADERDDKGRKIEEFIHEDTNWRIPRH